MIITAGRILHPYLIYITHGLLSSSSFTLLNILYKIFPLTFTSCTFRVVTVSLLAISNFTRMVILCVLFEFTKSE